jgi:AraC family transcriptional activator of pobA
LKKGVSNSGFKLPLKGFKVYELESTVNSFSHHRRDCYKICIVNGFSMAKHEHSILIGNGGKLLFGSPSTSYTGEVIKQPVEGFACVFTKDFMAKYNGSFSDAHRLLFPDNTFDLLTLTAEQTKYIFTIFEKIHLTFSKTSYFRNEEIINYLQILMHEALKIYIENIDISNLGQSRSNA